MSRRGWVMFAIMCVIWGIPYLLIKVAVGSLTPASLVFVRTALATLLLFPLAAARGELRVLLPRWRPLLAYTAAELAIPWVLLSSAEQRLTSSTTGLLIAAVPLVGAVLVAVTGGQERLGTRRIIGLLAGRAGVAALVGDNLGGGTAVAFAEIGVVVIGYALGPFILARHLSELPAIGVVAASLALTTVLYLPAGIVQLPHRWPSASVVASLLVLAVVCTAVAFLVFFALIDEVGPVRATVITYVNPAVAVALGVALLHEPFTVGIAAGFVLILVGSVMATGRSVARPHRPAGAPTAPAEPAIVPEP
ncbi:MAG: hypothetical protein QOI74_1813 [Micromonosporaceae bacterium]|nr:hypothetical protein [Micromonosporaceae bacterium]